MAKISRRWFSPKEMALFRMLQRPSAEWPARFKRKARRRKPGTVTRVRGTGPKRPGVVYTLSIDLRELFQSLFTRPPTKAEPDAIPPAAQDPDR